LRRPGSYLGASTVLTDLDSLMPWCPRHRSQRPAPQLADHTTAAAGGGHCASAVHSGPLRNDHCPGTSL